MNKGFLNITLLAGCILFLTGCVHSTQPVLDVDAFNPEFSLDTTDLPRLVDQATVVLEDGDNFNLEIIESSQQLGDRVIKRLTYNGSIPGPLIKVKQGSTIYLNLKNKGDVEAILHSHGLRLENPFDGTHAVQDPIAIGDTFQYKLTFPDPGLFWYHPHHREDYAQDMGLYGNYLVEPNDPTYWSEVNREVTLVIDDILLDDGQVVPYKKDSISHTIMGRYGNELLINGRDDFELQVTQGEVIRLLITNVANTRPFNLKIEGAELKLVGSDLGKYEYETFIDELIISPSERYIVDAYFPEAGEYSILNSIPSGDTVMGDVQVKPGKLTSSFAQSFKKLRTNNDIIADIDDYRKYFNVEPDKFLDLSVELTMNMDGFPCHQMSSGQWMGDCDDNPMKMMADLPCHQMPDGTWMGNCDDEESANHDKKIEWEDDMEMMNSLSTNETVTWQMIDQKTGEINTDIDWQFKVGDVVKIKLFNDPKSDHPMQHPFHIHGQRFLVLSTNGVANKNLTWKDTTLLQAGDTVEILLDITNPGTWLVHCHISEHVENGMKLKINVTE